MTSIAHGGNRTTARRRPSVARPHRAWRLWFRVGLTLALLVGAGFGVGTAVGYALVKTFSFVHLGTAP